MAIGMHKMRIIPFAAAITAVALLLLATLGIVLFRSRFPRNSSNSLPARRADALVQFLKSGADPAALQAAAIDLIAKYPVGPHYPTQAEIPDSVKTVCAKLGLGEILVCNDVLHGCRILLLGAPGGFASYGIKIPPQGIVIVPRTNDNGLQEREWTNGICVYYSQ